MAPRITCTHLGIKNISKNYSCPQFHFVLSGDFSCRMLVFEIYISTPSTRKECIAESKASRGRKKLFFSNVPNSLVFYYTWFTKPNSRVQRRSEQYLEVCFVLFPCTGGACAEAKIFSEKKNFIRRFAWFDFSRLSLAFILKQRPILHAVNI